MRLIDADAMVKEIEKAAIRVGRHYQKRRGGKPYIDGCRILLANVKELLSNSPTAYDVDKVVGCIEAIKENGACDEEDCGYCKYFNPCWNGDMSDRLALDKAIEIVKGGGTDD